MTTGIRHHRRTRLAIATTVTLGLLAFGAGCSATATDDVAKPAANPTIAVPTEGAPEAGTADAAAWEALMGEDGEYMSAAMYDAVVTEFGSVEPYISILAAENHHSDMLAMHLRRAGYTVPRNPYLGTVDAPKDLVAAAKAWADGEVRNIAMYDALADQVKGDQHLTMMFEHLKGASKNAHLPLFKLAAENGGQLSQEEMAKWSNSMLMMGMEMGDMGGMGMGGMGGMNGMNGQMGGHDMSSMSPSDGASHDMGSMGHDMSSMSPSPSS